MIVQVNSDSSVDGREELVRQIDTRVANALRRFSKQITRVEVHLSDENGTKPGDNDKRCLIEARMAGLKPVAASHKAPTIQQAVDGAAAKLTRSLERTIGRLSDQQRSGEG